MGAPKKFRLAPVLRIREMQERVAAGNAATAAHVSRQAEEAAAAAARDAATFAAPQSCDGAVFVAASHHGLRLLADVDRAAVAADFRARQADEAHREWTEAARATKVLEKLQDRHVEAVNSALEHAEIKAVDDIVTRAYAVRSASDSLEGHS
jgi:hypothetical protein